MDLKPKAKLSKQEIRKGLRFVIYDGLAAEAMSSFTGGAFLVALALLMGASNTQIGLLSSLPTFTHLFQLFSIALVRRFNNRRMIAVLSGLVARIPLVLIGTMALIFQDAPFNVILVFLFFYYLFGSIAGPSWNAWMKDLVPEGLLGSYFSRRSRYTQMLNVGLSLALAFVVDFIANNYPQYELSTYGVMFVTGGVIGIIGSLLLAGAPEPKSTMSRENVFKLLTRPLRDGNFRSLLVFNSAWVFSLNIATPFFTVFMLQTMGLSLTLIIVLNITSQVSSILTIRLWGLVSDRYSNKSVLAVCTPIFSLCLLSWCFVGTSESYYSNIGLLFGIHFFQGLSSAGINLALTNIGIKLAHRDSAVVYLTTRGIITSVFSSMAPVIGGLLADYFATRSLNVNLEWISPGNREVFYLLTLNEWNFLFLIGAVLAFISSEFLVAINEVGEADKDEVVRFLRSTVRQSLKEGFVVGNIVNGPIRIIGKLTQPQPIPTARKRHYIDKRRYIRNKKRYLGRQVRVSEKKPS